MTKSEAAFRAIVIDIATGFTGAWWAMLAVGDIHRFAPVVPLLSYWQVFWPVNLLITLLDHVAIRARYHWKADL